MPSPIGDAFRRGVGSFAEANHLPVVTLKAADRNVEVMRPYLDKAAGTGRSQVAAIGVAQEPQRVVIARQRHTDPGKPPAVLLHQGETAGSRPTTSTCGMQDFGPAFIKICTYFPGR